MSATPLWQAELGLLQSILEQTGLVPTVKWGIPVYTFKPTWIPEAF